jgi:hypothetical protein
VSKCAGPSPAPVSRRNPGFARGRQIQVLDFELRRRSGRFGFPQVGDPRPHGFGVRGFRLQLQVLPEVGGGALIIPLGRQHGPEHVLGPRQQALAIQAQASRAALSAPSRSLRFSGHGFGCELPDSGVLESL